MASSDPGLNQGMLAQPSTGQLSSTLAPLRILVLLFIAVPLLGYIAEGAWRYRQIRLESELRLSSALRIAQEHALKILQTNEIILSVVNQRAAQIGEENLRQQEKVLHDYLNTLSSDKAQTQSIWLWGADGRPLVSDRFYPAPAHINVSDRAYFRWHQANNEGLYLSERGVGRATGTPFFDMTRARRRPDGSFAGVTSVSLSPTYFEDFDKELLREEPGMLIAMLRSDNAILTRWPPMPNQASRLPPSHPLIDAMHAGQPSGRLRTVATLDGRERFLAYSKVGNYPVYIFTSMAVSELTERWLREMGWIAAFGLPPMLGLYLAARLALRRTREALGTAEQLKDETLNRRQVESALLQAQKMEALGRLTGGVAHDFNNALMVISTNLALLKRKNPAADDKQVQAIDRAVATAGKLTRQLLAFSRRQPLLPQCLNLHEWLGTAQDLLAPVLGRRVQLSVSVSEDVPAIYVDSTELELALLNLAINARDAMPSGGQLRITARAAADTELPPRLQGRMVLIEVSDTGSGIAADILDKVFEPFFTTKPVGEGTGLGLSQIYGLCQRAGGLATVQSQEGAGTTFRLFFPALDEPAHPPETPAPTELPHLAKNVLLVEDNDDVAAALILMLEAMGCQVKHFDRAMGARDWLAQQAVLPDVLLSDVVMPGEMDGLDLAKHVRSAYPELSILLISGYAQQLEDITKLGFDIIPKPCSPELLAQALERVIDRGRAGRLP